MRVVSELKRSPERTKAGARHPLSSRALAPAAETTLVSGSKSARVRWGREGTGGAGKCRGTKVGKGEPRVAVGEKKEKGGKRRNYGGKVHGGGGSKEQRGLFRARRSGVAGTGLAPLRSSSRVLGGGGGRVFFFFFFFW